MRIQITNVGGIETKMSAAGKAYKSFEVSFVADGRAAKKMIFASDKAVGKPLQEAAVGSLWDVTIQNDGKYENWVAVASAGQATAAEAKVASQAKSTYETPEERAKKQVYIVRQSSLANAIAFLGSKDGVTEVDVIEVAKTFESYVFSTDSNELPID